MTLPITVSLVREHVDTDWTDNAVQRAIDAADAEIVRRYGDHTADRVEVHRPGPGDVFIYTDRKIGSITSITETFTGPLGETVQTLSASDYSLESGHTIRRRADGPHGGLFWTDGRWPSWPRIVTVTYSPQDDSARRVMVELSLVQLAINYQPGVDMVSLGGKEVQMQYGDMVREREKILRQLAPSTMGTWA